MNSETLNTALYKKMFAEQELYRAELLEMEPEQILKNAYEYVCREDILLSLEYNDLSPRQAKMLLKLETPLDDIFRKWDAWKENDHMENILKTVKARANELIRAEIKASRSIR